MEHNFLNKWLKDLVTFQANLMTIGCSGDINLKIAPPLPRNEIINAFKSLPVSLSEAVMFLTEFYTFIGSSLSFDLKLNLPEGWVSHKNESSLFAHLEIVNPETVLKLIKYNNDRFIDSEPSEEVIENFKKFQPPGFPDFLEELNTFREVIRECLMFCVDDTGGGIVYYNGGVLPAGVYAVTMDTSEFVSETISGFLEKISIQCYRKPTSEIDWGSQWGSAFRAKLASAIESP